MQTRWTLVVEGLGRIERAEVRLHPFLLFVGENNSGKSYLASLLWGLMSLKREIFTTPLPDSEALDACVLWVQSHLERREEHHHQLVPEDSDLFLRLFNTLLEKTKNSLAASVFNVQEMSISKIEIKELERHSPLEVRWSVLQEQAPNVLFQFEQTSNSLSFQVPATISRRKFSVAQSIASEIAWNLVMNGVTDHPAHPSEASFPGLLERPTYLPASRTGFMLLHKAVVQRQIGLLVKSHRSTSPLDLTLPTIEFLELLAVRLKPTEGPYQSEAAFLEQQTLQGHLEFKADAGGNDFRYHPQGSDSALPMALSSSLVTELAPIILTLRHIPDIPVLIVEEPEAHLHPKIQRVLAQTLVRLIRKGLNVWVTTHSENFCQQIDNFLKLGQLPKRAEAAERLGYEEQDYLELSEVAGYQFVSKGASSVVSELEKSPAGLTMPTFNDELLKLAQETLFLQRSIAKTTDES
jgi:energy-coupling factor transporter ATP-binding protein EcfA2